MQQNQNEKKERKRTSGPLRDKSRTMARMVAAVGKVIQKKGYPGLTAPNIATAAGVDKKLVWTYFGGTNNLIEEYINNKDFWKVSEQKKIADLLKSSNSIGAREISNLLCSQFETMLKDKSLQKIIHWELEGNNKVLKKIAQEREEIGEQLFSVIIPRFEEEQIDLRGRIALIIGGIYYLSLHAKNNGSTFCGIDINIPEEESRIKKVIQNLITESFKKIKDQ